jgi:hypothetical protein
MAAFLVCVIVFRSAVLGLHTRVRKMSLSLVLFCVSGIDTYISVLILHPIGGTAANRIMSGFLNPTHKENQ